MLLVHAASAAIYLWSFNYNYSWNFFIGILETIFDGIQRPLQTIAQVSKSVFVPRGVDVPSLDQNRLWTWNPSPSLSQGDLVEGGYVLGTTFENDLFAEHRIMVPPKVSGRIHEVMPIGQYTVKDTICTIETPDNKIIDLKMAHFWPVRNPRPVA